MGPCYVLVVFVGVTLLSGLVLFGSGPNEDDSLVDGPSLFGQPVRKVEALSLEEAQQRREAFERMLEARGEVLIGDQVRPADAQGNFTQPPAPQAGGFGFEPHRSTIFLNFFGIEMMTNGNNADLDQSPCVPGEMEWPGFNGSEGQALALIQVFENQVAPYGIRIAYEERPPSHLPYAMVMMGGTPDLLGLPGGVLGVSCSNDCSDRWWRDTTFAFTANSNPAEAEVLGTTALHEAAHAFGLGHIADPSKVMNPFVGSADVTWADVCTPYDDSTGSINCMPTHAQFCAPGAQDTNAELLAYFGPNSPDMEPPVVTITSPADGEVFAPGDSVTVEAEITDNHDGVGWKLILVDSNQEAVAYNFEKSWPLGSLPEGSYTLQVEAIDHERNVTVQEITIHVGEAPSEGSTGTPLEGSSGAVDDTGTDGSPSLEDDEVKGCSCSTSSTPGIGFGVLSLLGLALVRRRRN